MSGKLGSLVEYGVSNPKLEPLWDCSSLSQTTQLHDTSATDFCISDDHLMSDLEASEKRLTFGSLLINGHGQQATCSILEVSQMWSSCSALALTAGCPLRF